MWMELNAEDLKELHVRGFSLHTLSAEVSLVVKGELSGQCIGVVGARASDGYGLTLARQLGRDLAQMGVTVVSGGAEGCDRAAHEGALEAGGKTVVVLPCGHDHFYPEWHADLFARIASQGAVVSPFWLDTKPTRARFLARNKVLAELCDGVIVVRAAQKSGTAHTAQITRKLGKPLAAVVGGIGEGLSQGPHHLIEEGATPILSRHSLKCWVEYVYGKVMHAPSEEWPQHYHGQGAPWSFQEVAKSIEFTNEEASLARVLRAESGLDLDTLVMRTGLPVESLVGLLLGLEVNGIVERMPGGRYRARGQGE